MISKQRKALPRLEISPYDKMVRDQAGESPFSLSLFGEKWDK